MAGNATKDGLVYSNHGRSKSARGSTEVKSAAFQKVFNHPYQDADFNSDPSFDHGNGKGLIKSAGGLSAPSDEASFTLPPLSMSKSIKAAETLDSFMVDVNDGAVSPTKRGRKKALALYSEGAARSLIQTSLDIDMREKEMALLRENKKEYGRQLVEMWVNQVLDPGGVDITDNRTQPLHADVTTMRGLASFGLTRVELLGAGLNHAAVDRLYRGLYVYTIGFFDIMQDTLEHSEFRLEILSNVWRAFLFIAEAAMKVAFKGDFLHLFQAQQITAAELLVTKEALAEATKDAHQTEKALAWLTAAHAEERALRVSARAEAAAAADQLSSERAAHQAAVSRLVTEMEHRAKLALEVEKLEGKLVDAAAAQADLVSQRDQLVDERDTLYDKCTHVMCDVLETYNALMMEDELTKPDDLLLSVQQAEEQEQQDGSEGGLHSLKAKSSLVHHLNNQLYDKWRQTSSELDATRRELYATRDTVRSTKKQLLQSHEEATAAREEADKLSKLLQLRVKELEETSDALAETQQTLKSSQTACSGAEEEISRLEKHVQGLEELLLNTGKARDEFQQICERQANELSQLHNQVLNLNQQLQHSQWIGKEMSKGFAISMRALQANQSARGVLQRKLKGTRADAGDLLKQLNVSERNVRVLEGKVEELERTAKETQAELIRAQKEVKSTSTALETATAQIAQQGESLRTLQVRSNDLANQVGELTGSLDRTSKLLSANEDALTVEREEVTRLYSNIQTLEQQLEEDAQEKARLAKKVEQAKAEVNASEEKFKRREATLNLEIKRLQSEVRLERSRLQNAEMQIDSLRKNISEFEDLMARKRQKKRKWKKAFHDCQKELEHSRSQLATARKGLSELEGRITPMEVDLAILMADRGRPGAVMPTFASVLASHGAQSPITSSHQAPSLHSSRPASGANNKDQSVHQEQASGVAVEGQDEASPSTANVRQSPPASRPGSKGSVKGSSNQQHQRHVQQGVYEGVSSTSNHQHQKGRAAATEFDEPIPSDMLPVYNEWDEYNRKALDVQMRLNQHSKELDKARQIYERARAIHYTNPVDKSLQERMTVREKELTEARRERDTLEAELDSITSRIRELQNAIHEHEADGMARRMEQLQQRTGKQEAIVRTEMGLRVDEAEGRSKVLQDLLHQQRTAYDMLMASRKHLEGDCAQIEAELRGLSEKLVNTVNDRIAIEESLRAARAQVTYLQNELVALMNVRDTLKGQVQDAEDQIAGLKLGIEAASANVNTTLKRVEAKLEEEKNMAIAAITKEKNDLAHQLAHHQELVESLSKSKSRLETDLAGLLNMLYHDLDVATKPSFVYHIRPKPMVVSAMGLLPGFSRPCNIDVADPVAHYIAPCYERVLVIISQLYVTKILADCAQEDCLLGGKVGERRCFEGLIYDFFVARYGCRQSAELHLSAFLVSVQKFRLQHPKIRVFSRLLGLDDPLPPSAQEFFCALLNRIHARAGPLYGEASDGQASAKVRIVAKCARELLRGSFTNVNHDAASLSDTLKGLAGGDEEALVEVDVAAEMALKAWWCQFAMDVDALETAMRASCPPRYLTPDDLLAFLRQVDLSRAQELSQEELLEMFRCGVRAAGPQPTTAEQRRAVAQAILEHGFLGMSAYRSRLEAVKNPPPYDEILMLEDSWRALRPLIQQQLNFLDTHKEVRADLASYLEVGKKLDLAMESRENPAVPWALYRRIMVLYCTYRKAVEDAEPWVPPEKGAMTPLTSSAASSRPMTAEMDVMDLHDPAAAAIAEAELAAAAAKAAVFKQQQQHATAGSGTARKMLARAKKEAQGSGRYDFSASRRGSRSGGGGGGDEEGADDVIAAAAVSLAAAAGERKAGGLLRPRSASPNKSCEVQSVDQGEASNDAL